MLETFSPIPSASRRGSRRAPRPASPPPTVVPAPSSHAPARFAAFFAALCAIIALLLLALPAGAQEAAPGVFGEVIDVRVVNVEVVVEDEDGIRVTGLSPDDFELLVDGEPMPIRYFTEVRGGQAVVSEGADSVPALEANRPVGTSWLVFIDDYFSIERDRNQVIGQLRQQLDYLGPEDRMAVVAYDGQGVEMLTSWTRERSELEGALRRASVRPARGLERTVDLQTMERNRGLGEALGNFSGGLGAVEREYAGRLSNEVERAATAAAATLRGFAQPPGRKVMVMLSGGWPLDPLAWTANSQQGLPATAGNLARGGELLEPLVDTANLLGYTLYPVDVPGLESRNASVDQVTPTSQFAAGNIGVREQELHASLRYAAEQTGGRALINSLREDVLAGVAGDISSYYWIGFEPERQEDNRRHTIEVRVKRDDLDVRTREGFVDLSRSEEVSLMAESALLFGNAPTSDPLPVQVGTIERVSRSTVKVPLAVAIPVDAVTFLPSGDRWVARVEVRIAALDERGERSEVPVVPVDLSSPEEPAAGEFVRFDTEITLRRADHRLVVSLYDPPTGRILTNAVRIEP